MNKTEIALRYKLSIVLSDAQATGCSVNENIAVTLSADMMRLGFVPERVLFEELMSMSVEQLTDIYNDLIPELKKLKGADVAYEPMYPNFPTQVMEADYVELFINAILHYFTAGQWMPDYEKLPRDFAFEDVKFTEIGSITNGEFDRIFARLLTANESLSETDKKTVRWFADRGNISFQGEIPFKENLCFIAALLLEKGRDISRCVKTTTDVLRIATALSDGDISLAENTKFKSFPRKTRRQLVAALEKVVSVEDLNRYRGKWARLFHSLHVGEIASPQLAVMADLIRNNKKINTFNGMIEALIADKNVVGAADLLLTRPGVFARRIDHLLRLSSRSDQVSVIARFFGAIPNVDTRVLLQLLGNLKVRGEDRNSRVVFPKGQIGKAQIVRKEILALPSDIREALRDQISYELIARFTKLPTLGKVWIDPNLAGCPIPTQMRSASEGALQVGRGTRLPIGDDKSTLRFFIYWVGQDIDLSATLHNESFEMIEHIGYTNLRSHGYQSCHSGDITSAPRGASEFIDITIDGAVKAGARYVVMNVFVYSGPTFSEHKKVYAGWMTRSKPNSNEIYDPKTVEQKIDLTSESRVSIPVVFDLVERKAIWTDLSKQAQFGYGGNNVQSNKAGLTDILEAIVNKDNKVTLYELFEMHAEARATEVVTCREDADFVFSTFDGDVTPYNIAEINSEYIK